MKQMGIEWIQEKARNWSVDYKPWDRRDTPQNYGEYGFIQGYKQAIIDFKKGNPSYERTF